MIHNHPSGSAEPSSEDEKIETALQKAGELLAIPVLDFLIIGENGWYWSSADGKQKIKNREVVETISAMSPMTGGETHDRT